MTLSLLSKRRGKVSRKRGMYKTHTTSTGTTLFYLYLGGICDIVFLSLYFSMKMEIYKAAAAAEVYIISTFGIYI